MELKLLIAEPNQPLQPDMVHYFSQQGIDVRSADNVAGLVRQLQRDLPPVVLLEPEILCSGVSGSAPSVPTVVLTRLSESAPTRPESFVVRWRYDKPARLAQVRACLRAAAAAGAQAQT
jgi:hypothetical protein